jgi:penicillin-binding protein 1A
MQVARDFYLSKDKFITRKLAEAMLAYRIEDALSKDKILELYMNNIYLGQRSYGFASASQAYFGKSLKELSIAEMAMLAGLPQNPSRNNPAVNPKKARSRQQVVLRRMFELDYITEAQYEKAKKEQLHVNHRGQEFDVHAEYVAELARQAVFAQFKEESYTKGINVYTTIQSRDQEAAYDSVRRNVVAYDQRHGYRGPETYIELPADEEERGDAIDEVLTKRVVSDGLIPAVVLEASPTLVKAETSDGDVLSISGDGLKLAASALSSKAKPASAIRPGAVIRVMKTEKKGWAITQVPQVAAAFVALDANTGAYQAMVGGFDYGLQKFNHVTQAWRQPGSSIKPFIYSAAVSKGFGPGTVIADEPLELPGSSIGQPWTPQNDDFKFDGQVTMRPRLPGPLRLRPVPPSEELHHGAGHRRRDAAAAGGRLRGVCQRRLQGHALPDLAGHRLQGRADHGHPAAGARHFRRTRARRAQCLHHGQHDARRNAQWYRRRGRPPWPP